MVHVISPDCCKSCAPCKIDIFGNNNIPVIINGHKFNVSSFSEAAATLTIKKYRFELFAVHFISIAIIFVFILMIIKYLISRRRGLDIRSVANAIDKKCSSKPETDSIKYKNQLKKFDNALNEIDSVLCQSSADILSLTSSFQTIDSMYSMLQTSLYALSHVKTKLIDKNYAGLCITILKTKEKHMLRSEAWQISSSILHSLSCYMQSAPELCHAAVAAGIIPLLTSDLSKPSYLADLDKSQSITFIFEMTLRIFHTIAQIEELKHCLLQDNCFEILLRVMAHTKNKILRAICLLTVARISKESVIRIPLKNNDGGMLFRLYYESTIAKDGMVYGLKHNELLSGFSAIGRLECHFTEIGNS